MSLPKVKSTIYDIDVDD